MARRKKRSFSSPISIGNCKVEIDGGERFVCDSSEKRLCISSTDGGSKITISVNEPRKYITRRSHKPLTSLKAREGGGCFPLDDQEFVLVNPKDSDSNNSSILQEVLKIYKEELPTMNYSANTGKESLFLERCVSSGKYKTLLLRSNYGRGLGGEVNIDSAVAAMSYQIIPTDTQYAEIPLAAVSSKYQNKGIGCLLYSELRERLQRVGISTIFCWADKESEGFWLKQGFISIGEVDSKGKARRLPIKADIRRSLCFPGGSTLMVAHLKKDAFSSNSSEHVILQSLKCHAKQSGSDLADTALLENKTNSTSKRNPCEPVAHPPSQKTDNAPPHCFMNHDHPTNGISPNAFRLPYFMNSVPSINLGNSITGADRQMIEDGHGSDSKHQYTGPEVKKRVWEASLSSLKSKRVRGGHLSDYSQEMKQHVCSFDDARDDSAFVTCPLNASRCKQSVNMTNTDPVNPVCFTSQSHSEDHRSGSYGGQVVSKESGPRIMLMNIADDAKKTSLTKIVEELGGSVTSDGSLSTHVITGKARRTLNFCIALCSGAWIVSSLWLKASFREGKFLGESEFLLEEEEYLLKYKCRLRDAVMRARENPHSLLNGYDVCVAKHIQPSVNVLSAIIKSAGGRVIRRLDGIREPSKSIFIACEEDMEEAMIAAKTGVWTFSSDWLMSCVMKQEIDVEAPQFAESL